MGSLLSELIDPTPRRPVLPTVYDFGLPTFTTRDGSPSTKISDHWNSSGGWIEQIGNHSPGTDEVSPKFANSTIFGWCSSNATSRYNFDNSVVGYHWVDGSLRLRRSLPIRHPRKPQLHAVKVFDAKGVKFQGRNTAEITNEGITTYANYDRTQVGIEFIPLKYNVFGDDDIMGVIADDGKVTMVGPPFPDNAIPLEYLRYVEVDPETNIYDVSIQTGQFVFAEGAANAPKSIKFPGELNYLEVKTTFMLTWRYVPQDFVFAPTTIFPYAPKIPQIAGRINSREFAGFPAGTLLCLEPKIDRYQSGSLRATKVVDNSDGTTTLRYVPYFYADISLPIIHFDPPHYSQNERGHNVKPWWNQSPGNASWVLEQSLTGAFSAASQKLSTNDPGVSSLVYYLVTSDGTTTGVRIYGSYDYYKFFQHWSVV